MTLLVSGTGGLWPHPVQTVVGRQGGAGCQGDIQEGIAKPSSTATIGKLEWESFAFTCAEANVNFAPGVEYDGRAWEVHRGDYIVSLILIQTPSQQFASEVLQQSLVTFTLR